ncbi:toll/interleukin-1 receptor domain-containing protein [Streptomyces beijiangensis]|uniref:TIR domain-containing protein n=2 Tax=Streptomyces beijiangensis TaxID=163361 RepID=A0A939JJZ0_9ACTN|nr:toll/interleukin-1 receptor domain-containing protein [Streptomyces beijiangensis]MBO0515267.1 TIR domain-containing protein [Streptomyces beijiangensis]
MVKAVRGARSAELIGEYDQGRREFVGRDLTGIHISEQVLRNSVFNECRFVDCIISRTDLSDCTFDGCHFERVNAVQSDFIDARFQGCTIESTAFYSSDFFRATFTASRCGSNFREAFFVQAQFLEMAFFGSVFEEAVFGFNVFEKTLLAATTFNSSRVLGPSRFDAATVANALALNIFVLNRNKKEDPSEQVALESVRAIRSLAEFFVASGVDPGTVHARLKGSLFEAPSAHPSVFISYSARDTEFASMLQSRLDREGIDAWFAPHDIQGGRTVQEQLIHEIQERSGVVLILSEASMASAWVTTEILLALQSERQTGRRMLFPVRLVDEDRLRSWHMVDTEEGYSVAHRLREDPIPDFSPERTEEEMEDAFITLLRNLRGPAGNASGSGET